MDEFPLLHDPPDLENTDSWICKIPIVGWQIGSKRQYANEDKLVNQVIERGHVPPPVWDAYPCNSFVRERVESIICECAYQEDASFHPEDPVELMMILRYGDLNEMEIIIAIEHEFGIEFSDEYLQQLETSTHQPDQPD